MLQSHQLALGTGSAQVVMAGGHGHGHSHVRRDRCGCARTFDGGPMGARARRSRVCFAASAPLDGSWNMAARRRCRFQATPLWARGCDGERESKQDVREETRWTLEVRDVFKSFGKRTAVAGVSVSVSSGEVVGVLGPNGSGKSTLFRIAVGRTFPDEGEVTVCSLPSGETRDVTHVPLHARAKEGVLYVPQEPSVFRDWTVAENVICALDLAGVARKDLQRRTERTLDAFTLSHVADTRSSAVSGGERRRLEIARVLARFESSSPPPRFLVVDEPFAGVDPKGVKDLQALFMRLASERQLGVLVTDHNVPGVLGVARRAYVLHEGAVLASGSPDYLENHPSVREAYLT